MNIVKILKKGCQSLVKFTLLAPSLLRREDDQLKRLSVRREQGGRAITGVGRYTQEDFLRALTSVKNGEMSVRAAS